MVGKQGVQEKEEMRTKFVSRNQDKENKKKGREDSLLIQMRFVAC
jgi:hypothetical protein